MNVRDYFDKINDKCQTIFQDTLKETESFGKVHHLSSCLFEFSENLNDENERSLLRAVCSQIEASALSLSLGLYRQAFSSLRLALELGLGTVHFSLFKLEHHEWLIGCTDIKWSKLINEENGILSHRVTSVFFPELNDHVKEYNDKASNVYRKLSEYVHGNYETWEKSGLVLKKNDELISSYFRYLESVKEVLLFALCCRYMKSLTSPQLEAMQFISDDLGHVEPIRLLMGGPKER
jgi:hypothetical protein